MKNAKKEICLGLPEGLTGKELKAFLKRSHLLFFHPKKKIKTTDEIKKLHSALHSSLMQDKLRSGKLVKIEPSTKSVSKN